MLTLENQNLRLEFDEQNGALASLTAVQSGWKILDRPQLGIPFRLLVPLSEERRNNPVYGEKQKLVGLEASPDRQRAVFVWDKLNSEVGGVLPIRFILEVTLKRGRRSLTQWSRTSLHISSKTCIAPTWAISNILLERHGLRLFCTITQPAWSGRCGPHTKTCAVILG